MIAVQVRGFDLGRSCYGDWEAMTSHVQHLEISSRAFEHAEQIGEAVASTQFDAVLPSSDPLADGVAVEAAVKWFNATKGYGFVELSDGRGDAFLHLKTLRETGRQTLPSGAKIRVVARAGSRGAEVVRVVEVDPRSAMERSSRRSTVDPSAAFDLTGKVKWFDDTRGLRIRGQRRFWPGCVHPQLHSRRLRHQRPIRRPDGVNARRRDAEGS